MAILAHTDIIGKRAYCKITGFEGVVKGICTFRTAAPRVCIQGSKLHDEKPTERQWFDLVELGIDEKQVIEPVPLEEPEFQFGDRVRVKTTGIEGIVDGSVFWATGCLYLHIQPPGTTRDGEKIKSTDAHPDDLELIERASKPKASPKAEERVSKPGGPHDFDMSEAMR